MRSDAQWAALGSAPPPRGRLPCIGCLELRGELRDPADVRRLSSPSRSPTLFASWEAWTAGKPAALARSLPPVSTSFRMLLIARASSEYALHRQRVDGGGTSCPIAARVLPSTAASWPRCTLPLPVRGARVSGPEPGARLRPTDAPDAGAAAPLPHRRARPIRQQSNAYRRGRWPAAPPSPAAGGPRRAIYPAAGARRLLGVTMYLDQALDRFTIISRHQPSVRPPAAALEPQARIGNLDDDAASRGCAGRVRGPPVHVATSGSGSDHPRARVSAGVRATRGRAAASTADMGSDGGMRAAWARDYDAPSDARGARQERLVYEALVLDRRHRRVFMLARSRLHGVR